MDRTWSPAAFHPPAVRTARAEPFDVALSTGTGFGRRPAADAFDRRAVSHRPFFGSRRMTLWLCEQGEVTNRKRVQRLMRQMGIEAIYPRPRTTWRDANHRVFPYLLRGVTIQRPNHVWSSNITYVPMPRGFMYLTAVMDWYSRYVLAWRLSNSLEGSFCLEALDEAVSHGKPQIFNTDQGVQYTASVFIEPLTASRGGDQHGRPGPSARQRVRRATVAEREVRVPVPCRLRDRGGPGDRTARLLQVLQPRTAAPRLEQFAADRGLPSTSQKPIKKWRLKFRLRRGTRN